MRRNSPARTSWFPSFGWRFPAIPVGFRRSGTIVPFAWKSHGINHLLNSSFIDSIARSRMDSGNPESSQTIDSNTTHGPRDDATIRTITRRNRGRDVEIADTTFNRFRCGSVLRCSRAGVPRPATMANEWEFRISLTEKTKPRSASAVREIRQFTLNPGGNARCSARAE